MRVFLRIVTTAHIFERRWHGDTHGDGETKTFVVTESSEYGHREEIEYLTMGLTQANIWI